MHHMHTYMVSIVAYAESLSFVLQPSVVLVLILVLIAYWGASPRPIGYQNNAAANCTTHECF